MAEEKTNEEAEDTGQDKSSKGILLVIAITCLVLVCIMGAGFFTLWNKLSPIDPQIEKGQESITQEKGSEDLTESRYSLDTFIVNLSDKGGKRYLRITMDLVLSHEALTQELDDRLSEVRHNILMILPTKSLRDISSVGGKIALRDEILAKLNSFLETGGITDLYFTEFVIQ